MESLLFELTLTTIVGKERIGSKAYSSSLGVFKDFHDALLRLKRHSASKDSEDKESDEKTDRSYSIDQRILNRHDLHTNSWTYSGEGNILDGTNPLPYQQIFTPRNFSINQIVGVIVGGVCVEGVIRSARVQTSLTGDNITVYGVQTSLSKDNSSYKAYLTGPQLLPIQQSELEEHRLHWLALELLEDALLDDLEKKLNHKRTYSPSSIPFVWPKEVIEALLSRSAFIRINREILDGPNWASSESVTEKLGLYSDSRSADDAIKRIIETDPHSAWTFDGQSKSPYPLVLRYSFSIERVQRPSGEDGSEPWWCSISFEFDRVGSYIGCSDWSDRPSHGRNCSELNYMVGDIVALPAEQGFRPAVIERVPTEPKLRKIVFEANDEVFILESGIITPKWEDWNDVQEADIMLFEAPLSGTDRRRLARIIAPEDLVKGIIAKFHFGS